MTREQDAQAMREGWAVFMCDDGKHRIQRLDDPSSVHGWKDGDPTEPVFADDRAAINFVRKLARKGEAHAIAALALVTDVRRGNKKEPVRA